MVTIIKTFCLHYFTNCQAKRTLISVSHPAMVMGMGPKLYEQDMRDTVCIVPENFVSGLDPCESNPCLNKGRCEKFGISFFCLCSLGYTGRRCETQVVTCGRLNNNCLNGGTCVQVNKKNSCVCTPKFTGVLCEYPTDGCAAIHCMNDGTCLNVSDGFRCICKPYFKGTYCEQIDTVRPKKHSGYFPAQDPKPVMFATLIATIATFVCCFVGTVVVQQTKNDKQDTEDDEQLADIRLAQSGYDSYS
ncbi:hypothetical protein M514_19751 [Trichuris suis]|uniref:EGF-like domain-containing protein n=1 Tax=Trichuris suis TaxID=68888 RepID=A0A085NF16_9BILA|nr:hypothetical protein M514_19751 [Trichuris suis]